MLVRGTRDIINEDAILFNKIKLFCQNLSKKLNFQEIELPIIEKIETFTKNLGSQTDIVSKEMFIFEDKKGEKISLRPEFTASIARMYNSNFHQSSWINKFFTFGPLFRYNRPQKGRYRQFFQANYEAINDIDIISDIENIKTCSEIISQFANINSFTLEINCLPKTEGLEKYKQYLIDFFSKNISHLSEYALERYKTNPLRILDSKSKTDADISKESESISNFLSKQELSNYQEIQKILSSLNINYKINDKMVRGLDYYNGLVFEFVSGKSDTGSQSSVAGGGRYDGLINKFGKNSNQNIIKSSGFAIGVDRLMLNNEKINTENSEGICFILLKEAINEGLEMVYKIRQNLKIRSEVIMAGKIKKQISDIVSKGFKFLCIIGSDEINSQKISIKNLQTSTEHKEISIENATDLINIH